MVNSKKLETLFGLFFLFIIVNAKGVNAGAKFTTAPSFYGQKYADVPSPRGLFLDTAGDILVISKSSSSIIALSETVNEDGSINVSQNTIVDGSGLSLSHGITYFQGYVYASSATTVYRWPYVAGCRVRVKSQPEIVVFNLPAGGYTTRTLAFDENSKLYVSVGSMEYVDLNSNRSRILRFDFSGSSGLPAGGINYSNAEVCLNLNILCISI